jgi:hypothetical protein
MMGKSLGNRWKAAASIQIQGALPGGAFHSASRRPLLRAVRCSIAVRTISGFAHSCTFVRARVIPV